MSDFRFDEMEQRALAAEAALLSATKELDAARATNRDLVRAKSEAYAMGERAAEADLKTALEAVKADLVKEKEMVRIFASQAAGWSEDIQTAEEERDSALAQLEAMRADVGPRLVALETLVAELCDSCEEGWNYAPDYFREKWHDPELIARARALISPEGT